jgi:hypothetical protein
MIPILCQLANKGIASWPNPDGHETLPCLTDVAMRSRRWPLCAHVQEKPETLTRSAAPSTAYDWLMPIAGCGMGVHWCVAPPSDT